MPCMRKLTPHCKYCLYHKICKYIGYSGVLSQFRCKGVEATD